MAQSSARSSNTHGGNDIDDDGDDDVGDDDGDDDDGDDDGGNGDGDNNGGSCERYVKALGHAANVADGAPTDAAVTFKSHWAASPLPPP